MQSFAIYFCKSLCFLCILNMNKIAILYKQINIGLLSTQMCILESSIPATNLWPQSANL